MIHYAAPCAVTETIELLSSRAGSRIVAGGTDLVVAARSGKQPLPESLIALHRVDELGRQHEISSGIALGALTSHAWIERSPLVRSRYSALADASAMIGSPATRATGTLGGNLMNASPAMDTGSPLIVLGATVELRSTVGARRLPVAELLKGPGRTSAAAEELLTAVHLPHPLPRSGSGYVRLDHRQAMEIAIVGAAAMLALTADGLIESARIALTAVAPTCIGIPAAEDMLLGCRPEPELFADAARVSAGAVQPISDVRASARYRHAMTAVVVTRALTRAAQHAAADAVRTNHSPHAEIGRSE